MYLELLRDYQDWFSVMMRSIFRVISDQQQYIIRQILYHSVHHVLKIICQNDLRTAKEKTFLK